MQCGIVKEVLPEIAYLDVILNAHRCQQVVGLSTTLIKVCRYEIQSVMYPGDVALDQILDIGLHPAMPKHIVLAGVVAKSFQALQPLGDAVGIGKRGIGQLFLSGQDVASEEHIVGNVAGVTASVARQRHDLYYDASDFDASLCYNYICRTRLGIEARRSHLGDRLGATEHAHGTPSRILQNHRIMHRGIHLGPCPLNKVGIATHVIAVAMSVQNGNQMKALFLNHTQQPTARTLTHTGINQQSLLSLADNQTNIAGPRQIVDIVHEVLQSQSLALSIQHQMCRDYTERRIKRQGFLHIAAANHALLLSEGMIYSAHSISERDVAMFEPSIRSVYLSPHLDDAALSCGGLILQQVLQGMRPVVITCFAGTPDYNVLSPFAAEQHRAWGQPNDPIGQRRREDASAMTCLGAEYEHWAYLDCIYRRHTTSGEFLYASETTIFGELRLEDQGLIDELVARLRASFSAAGVRLYSPLTVGHHVDHQLVFRASAQLQHHGYSVQYYEDYPYAQSSTSLSEALSSWVVPPVSKVHMLDGEGLQAKISAIRLYGSQLGMLFGEESSMVAKVTSYALAVGGGQGYGERYWQEDDEA